MFRRKKVSRTCLKIFLDQTFEERPFTIDRNKIKDGKENVLFEPVCTLSERKKRRVFWRAPRKLILFVDGAFHALKFKEGDDSLQPYWTKEEARKFVNTEVGKTLTEHKPMTWGQFIVILIPLLIVLGLLVKIAMSVGAL